MFKPTRPFKDAVTSHPSEPSLRIGTTVPDDAVNLAYYYNPTASDAEKVLTAEAPKQTIDHRIEDDYRYLFDQVEPDDSLFPEAVYYEDEDGYSGRLGRMWVKWSPEVHTTAKTVSKDETVLVINKGDEPKAIDYSDLEDFNGTLYLDSTDYEVTKTELKETYELVEYTVDNYEVSLKKATGEYTSSNDIDKWLVEPGPGRASRWPTTIEVGTDYFATDGGTNKIRSYISSLDVSGFDNFTGYLTFEKFEYEPVGNGEIATDGYISDEKRIDPAFLKHSDEWDSAIGDISEEQFIEASDAQQGEAIVDENTAAIVAKLDEIYNECDQFFPRTCLAYYNKTTDEYDYSRILYFINTICPCNTDATVRSGNHECIRMLTDTMQNKGDIAIYRTGLRMSRENGHIIVRAAYAYKVSTRATLGNGAYNVIAVYTGTLFRNDLVESKEVPVEYAATCHYRGLARQITYDYDGQAYYRGSVTKGKSMGSLNIETPDELLMYPNLDNILRRKIEKTNDFGETEWVDFKNVEGEYFWLTDVFSNGDPCFYRYDLKHPIYSFKGADARGMCLSDSVDVNTSAYRHIPSGYKYAVRLTQHPNNAYMYDAGLYTNFKSWSADTFKATYKPYGETSNVTEDVYGYPFLTKEHGYTLLEVEPESRTNMIKLQDQLWFPDSRAYVSILWKVKVERKPEYTSAGVLIKEPFEYYTSEQYSSIINKDYACNCELNLFEDRGYIISPKVDGVRLSPSDMIFRQIALDGVAHEVPIRRTDTDLIFSVVPINDVPAVNFKCNPDGSGIITAETTEDTGFYNELTGNNDRKLVMDAPYLFENGNIFPGVMVKCIDSREICVRQPRNDKLLEPWYPIIQFGHYTKVMSQYGNHTKVCYSMPEYDDQRFNSTGRPYIDVNQCECEILNPHMVKVKLFPIYIKTGDANSSVELYKVVDGSLYPINIKDISFSDGIIITSDVVSENDKIVATYVYVEECYTYRGYWRSPTDFCRMDLNPNIYHTYGDLDYVPAKTSPTKNLFNKVVTFFLRPTYIFEEQDDDFSTGNDDDTVELVINPETGREAYRITRTEMQSTVESYTEEGIIGYTDRYGDVPVYRTDKYWDYTDLEQHPGKIDWAAVKTFRSYYDSNNNLTKITQNSVVDKVAYSYTSDVMTYTMSGAWSSSNGNNYQWFANDTPMSSYTIRTTVGCDQEGNYSPFKIRILTYKKQSSGLHDITFTFGISNPRSRSIYQSDPDKFTTNENIMRESGTFTQDMFNMLNGTGTYTSNGQTRRGIYATYAYLAINDNFIIGKELDYDTTEQVNPKLSPLWGTVKRISLFIAKLPDRVKIWISYNNANAWSDGVMPTTTADIEFEYDKYPRYQDSVKEAVTQNNRPQFALFRNTLLYNTYVTNLGIVQQKEVKTQIGTQRQKVGKDPVYGPVTKYRTVTNPVTVVEYIDKIKDYKIKNDVCLYHRIDTFVPEKDTDIYIGSVYIRQNTSLHSTVLVDSRTRGGGVLTSIPDGLRHELEAESDYYLDIGYYDGEPYQENGVIIVRIDRRVLKDFGGYFTPEDVDAKVKRWIGFGVLPIIEFVDTFGEKDLPQHSLEIEDTYVNITDDIPEFTVECIDV